MLKNSVAVKNSFPSEIEACNFLVTTVDYE